MSSASDRPQSPAADSPDLDVMIRPGANARVAQKKVLLAALASQEAERLGLAPQSLQIDEMRATLQRELELDDEAALHEWLRQADLEPDDLQAVMADFAAVLAIENHYRKNLETRLDRHRRLMDARARRLAEIRRDSG